MSAQGSGFLAIWSDVLPDQETDYLHWLTREHAAERVGIPGFLGVRIFRARSPSLCRYFILYRLLNAAVVGSAPYLERLNAPTPWSQRIMPILQNFVRGGGTITMEHGTGNGAMIVPVICAAADVEAVRTVLPAVQACDRIVSARLLEVEQDGTLIATKEKAIRRDDRSFNALLLVEALDDASLDAALGILNGVAGGLGADALRFDQVFALDRADLTTKAA
ncbi:hypothetical protein BH11PSE4_BH11PSE4_37500 [soil metagenome]